MTDGPSSQPPDLYRRLVETTSEGVWVLDAAGQTVLVNRSMSAMLGYAPEEMLGRSVFDFMSEEGQRTAAWNLERRRAGIAEAHEFVFLNRSGKPVWTRLTTNPIEDHEGKYQGALALVVDLTRERAEADEREQLWLILEQSLNEIYLFREDNLRFEYANAGALRNLLYRLETLRELTPLDLDPAHTEASLRALLAPLVDGSLSKLAFQTTHRRADQSTYPVDVQLQLVPFRGGRAFLAMVNDITRRQRAEQTSRESEARFRALIERNLDLILLLDERGAFTFASPSITSILGYTPEEMLQLDPLEIIHPEDRARASSALRRLLSRAEEVNQVQYRVRHANRSWRTLDANARSLLDDPAVRAVVVNARDVTDRYRLEEQLRQAQKLESIGRLAGGIAHDFNNILTTILGCSAFLEEAAGPQFAGLEDVREIKRAAQRASDLTGQLLAFARKQVISPRSVVLNQAVANAERFLRRVLGEHLELSTRLEPELWPIRIDPSQLEQLILNLAVNARDAMRSGGRLTIETSNVEIDPASAARHPELAPGPHVVLTVSDTGEGMTSEVLPHIFEPFFSTKGAGKGTGLGLATVYGIVRQSGGQITVQSEVSRGTTFKVYFPRSPEVATPLQQRAERSSAAPGSERILVVEDDDMVRQLAVRALESAGYAVTSAAGPQVVLESAEERPLPFDLLVTDIVMPGMSGKELASQLLLASPRLRVLFMSGYTEDAIAHHGELDAGVELLAKPFSPIELCARVRGVLDRD